MRTTLLTAIACIIAAAAAFAGAADYYPIEVGNTWVYQIHEGSQSVVSTQLLVHNVEMLNGREVFLLQTDILESTDDNVSGAGMLYGFSDDGDLLWYSICTNEGFVLEDFDPPHIVLPYDISVGSTWVNHMNWQDEEDLIVESISFEIISDNETVSIGIGDFNQCLKVREIRSGYEPAPSTTVSYYAKGVGLIKTETTYSDGYVSTSELTSYSFTPIAVETEQPTVFTLSPNYPNPFNPVTSIPFTLAHDAQITLAIYNIAGEKVATPAEGQFQAGAHSVEWDASEHASGVYVYRLNAEGIELSGKMTLVK